MKEREFLLELEKRARENEQLIKKSSTAFIVSIWLGEHPWRIIIPVCAFITLVLRLILGKPYNDAVLWIFGGL